MRNKLWFIDRDVSKQIVYIKIDEVLYISKEKEGSIMTDFIDPKNNGEFDRTIKKINETEFSEIDSITINNKIITVNICNGDKYTICMK